MQPQVNDEGTDPLTHRSAVVALALLAVLTFGSIIAPAAVSAQTSPSTTVAPATSTTEAPAPTSAAPTTAAPTTLVPAAAAPTATTVPAPATPAAPAAETGVKGPRNLAEATYIYTPREVKLAWNNSHAHKITLVETTPLASYLNAVAEAKIRQYLLVLYLNAVANATVPGQAGWERVAACETGGNWSTNTGNGYYGGLQFSLSTWRSTGGTGLPSDNSKAEQMRRANILKSRAGLGQWPRCGHFFNG